MSQVIAIDPGIGKAGYCILESTKFKKFNILEYGVLITDKDDVIESRLNTIYSDLKKILKKYPKINICATEKIFFVKNVTNGIAVSMAKGVILLAMYNHNISIYEYSPMYIKKTITGYGMADKISIRKMIYNICSNVNFEKQDDALDAIAIGITHLISNKYI